jgi:hypothetical protein
VAPAANTTPRQASQPKNTFVPPAPTPTAAATATATPLPPVVVSAPAALPPDVDANVALPFANVPELSVADTFADLAGALGGMLGQPLGPEQPTVDGCDTEQLTTTGLAFWRCASGTPVFVAADGRHRWALSDGQLLQWVGSELDAPLSLAAPTVADPVTLLCLGMNDNQDDACVINDGTTTATTIDVPGSDRVYWFEVADPGAVVHAELSNLPADYDLYLVDGSGVVLADSINEELLPEAIDAQLPAGPYLLYVHSDPGREVDPFNGFILHLQLDPRTPAN